MKRIIVLIVVAVCLAGCSGITADARHAALLDSTAAWSQAVSIKASVPDTCPTCVGMFTHDQVKALLKTSADLWLYMDQAKDGKGAMPTTPGTGG
jgi:hypothetical protein